jgi:glycerophosphoryl diester phosphodiesterase
MVEIDVVLTADGEPIILHDLTVDRTTDGHGFAADLSLERIRSLDAGFWFHQRFARTRIPTLVEVPDWANGEEMRLLVEIKEAERADLAVDRVASLVAATDTVDEYWRGGRDLLPKIVDWIGEGMIDAISGDDVPFIAKLVDRAGRAS